VHPIQFAPGQIAVGEGGLVGGGDQEEAEGFELAQRFDGIGFGGQLIERQRGGWVISFDPVAI
jgi:hypothetical protein